MNQSIKIITILLFSFFLSLAYADEKEQKTFKPGSAVTEFNKDDGFKLTPKAVKSLGVEFSSLKGKGPWLVPKESLVRIKHSTGVYRKYDNWITLVLVNIHSKHQGYYKISSVDLEPGDDVAIKGALYLRLTEADLNSDTVDSCAH
jgi:hypothetical protein